MYGSCLLGMKTRDLIEHLCWSIYSFSDITLHVKISGHYFNNKMMFHSDYEGFFRTVCIPRSAKAGTIIKLS